jgi:hypothetical protein
LVLSNVPIANATTGLSSIAPIVDPHVPQKARDEPFEERHVAGFPPSPVQVTRSSGTSIHTCVKLPECRWHILQEQLCGNSIGPTISNLMLPHKQPPL